MGNSVQIFFSNRDVLWATKHPQPRFAQGAFKAGLKAIWEVDKPAGTELLHTAQFGKPEQLQYEYAEAKMNKYRAQLLGEDAPKLRTCYMVGDNEESDIAGANNYVSPHGTKWESLLVESGVYKKGAVPKVQPTYIVAGVADAVKLACEREGFEAKFEF
jgi:ribonucleotide monophosphatase NagD (HAD superfamily)